MNSRRRLLKLFFLVALNKTVGGLARAEAADPADLPYFLKWLGTPDVQVQLQNYGKLASCNQGKALLKRMVVLTLTKDGAPMVLTQPPRENGVQKLQLGIEFDLGFHRRGAKPPQPAPDQPPPVRAYTSFGGPRVVYDLDLGEPEKPEFWTQPVFNVEQENAPSRHPSLREELGLPESARFAVHPKGDTYKVLGYLGLWFAATFEVGKLVAVREMKPTQEMPITYVSETADSK